MEDSLDSVLLLLEKKGVYYCYEHLKSHVEMMKLELKFLKMFFRGLSYWEELEYDWHLLFASNAMIPKFRQTAREFVSDCESVEDPNQWLDLEVAMCDFEKLIYEQLRPHIRDVCILLLGGSYKCTSCPPNLKEFLEYGRDMSSFTDLILWNLRELQSSYLVAPVMMQQIALLIGKLEEYGMFVNPVNLSITQVKKLYELISRARTWYSRISCLAYLYWIDGEDESLSASLETLLSNLLFKTTPFSTSGAMSPYLQPTMIPQMLAGHLDFLLEDLAIPLKDDIEILHEGLVFLVSFVTDAQEDVLENRGMIWAQIYAIINDFPSLIHSICSGEIKGVSCKANFSNLLLAIDKVKVKVRNLYLMAPYSNEFKSPNTNAIQFLNSLIGNMKEMLEVEVNLLPSFKQLCKLVHGELVSMRPLLENMVELLQDDGNEEIRDLWREVICMVYNADYVFKLSNLRSFSTWYGIVALPHVIERMKCMKIEINNLVGVDKVYNKKKLSYDQMEGTVALRPQATTSEIEIASMGFIEEERVIIDELTRGQSSLTIISISGSGGQGKTTLAKRIYNDLNVQYHFQKMMWCYVSKDCPVKELLVQILSNDGNGGGANEFEVSDLIERVWKSLKGKRYLVVLDDIWDVDTWHKLKYLFPDDKKGSRMLFTSRNHDLVSQVESSSISHHLPLFNDEESWELMRKRVFCYGDCGVEFVKIGRKIASYCKGLPLAVVLAAAVLGRTEQNLESWKKVAKNLKAHLAEEGCGSVIELSYRYLPDHLKSCFLYFGIFKRGEELRTGELKLLWIGEGFVIKDGVMKCSEQDLATEYLKDLVSQGLVVVTEMSSMGEIKRCNVHDLIYDLCLEKCKEDNFVIGYEWDDQERNIRHHRLRTDARDPFINSRPDITKRKLPTSPLHSFLWSANSSYDDLVSSLGFLGSFKILTVLKLKLGCAVDEFPEMILSSMYLRYLALYFEQGQYSRSIPPRITTLSKLETVIMDWPGFTLLPVSIWSVKTLKHVDISYARVDLQGFNENNSGELFRGASNVETLGLLYLDEDDSTTADFLRNFPNLRKLSCDINKRAGLSIWKLLSMVASLLPELESLDLSWGDRYSYEPNPNSSPSVCNLPKIENLKKLSLYRTKIPWTVLSEIGKQLPNLQVLKLRHGSCVGGSWNLEDGDFSKLTYLKLQYLDIQEIDASSCEEEPPFPCLEHLVLEACTLGEIPPVFGEIYTLKIIKVSGCSMELETSAMRILEEQREFGNNSLQVILQSL